MGKNGVLIYPPNEIFSELNSGVASVNCVFPVKSNIVYYSTTRAR
jgi:hypothetical protein